MALLVLTATLVQHRADGDVSVSNGIPFSHLGTGEAESHAGLHFKEGALE